MLIVKVKICGITNYEDAIAEASISGGKAGECLEKMIKISNG